MLLKTPKQLDTGSNSKEYHSIIFFNEFKSSRLGTWWIDVCPDDENLLAAGGKDNNVKIYDRRESRIVKTFGDELHSGRRSLHRN